MSGSVIGRRGPPKHQNKFAWKPNAGVKINETEVGGRLRPLSEITGVCGRCKGQIDWKRRYGKYKALSEPAKCQRCTKRAVRQAYHSLCPACAKEQNVCAKCCCRVDRIIGRDLAEVEAEQKMLEEAIKNARERDRRTLIRTMNKSKSDSSEQTPTTKEKVGELFPSLSLEDYAKSNGGVVREDGCADNDEDDSDNDDSNHRSDDGEDDKNSNDNGNHRSDDGEDDKNSNDNGNHRSDDGEDDKKDED